MNVSRNSCTWTVLIRPWPRGEVYCIPEDSGVYRAGPLLIDSQIRSYDGPFIHTEAAHESWRSLVCSF
ncbi:hypothetical protein SORBI_3002G268450 [Sorghum bicolor]|uniref:Uncharacterized protein n=1 Tax=Sorghum bicolor TaxID=4558 RepID=A0A1W0W5Z1_SORBI|nr:hypothetical protein SORBI_3002G268450 [Sorghum bicolor]